MNPRWPAWILAASLSAPLAGCFTVSSYVEDSSNPVSVTPVQGEARYHVKEEGRYWYLLYGLVPLSKAPAQDLLAKDMQPGTTISHLRITTGMTPTDVLITLGINALGGVVTFGILPLLGFSTRTVTYEGEVINTPKADRP